MNREWSSTLHSSLVSADELAHTYRLSSPDLAAITERYPLRITRYYYNLIREQGDPIWLQAVPDLRELRDEEQSADPLHEESLSPVPGLIHRYPDRVVWLVANSCAVYCRFCMRKRRVGCQAESFTDDVFADALHYLRHTPAIRDVILSGGDPLLLSDERLEHLLAALRQIPHIEIIRIGSRVPVTFPERITATLCSIIKRFHPVYLNTHFNHPLELTDASRRACAMLADAGIPLGNQTVLLGGVNDDATIMTELFRGLVSIRVKPYYLHQMDLVKGTAHFRTPVAKGLEIMQKLRGHVSGLAVPYYVIDLPGGKGKVPLLPQAVRDGCGEYRLTTYTGETVRYREMPG